MKYLIWWTTQEDCERTPEIDTWPEWLGTEYRSRTGRAGRGRLWVPGPFADDPDMPKEAAWDDSKWTCQAAATAGGIVIPAEHIHHVQWLPGFITTFGMELPAYADQQTAEPGK